MAVEPTDEEQLYHEYRERLHAGEVAHAAAFDKYLLTLSAGALGLSIAFVRELAGSGSPNNPWLLWLAWVGFGLAVTLCLAGILVSQNAHETWLGVLDNEHAKGGDFMTRSLQRMTKTHHGSTLDLVNRGALVTFILGTILLAIFTGCNLG